MPSQKNVESVGGLKEKLQRSQVVIVADFTGMNVATMTALRRKLKEQGSELVIAKNTLASIAAKEVGKEGLSKSLAGPTGLVLGYQDAVKTAKALDDYVKQMRITLAVRGGVLGAQPMGESDVQSLATLPSQQQLMAQLMGQLLASLTQLASVLSAPSRGLATTLQRHAEKQGAPAA
jgi:large subunit ribosomal protein L10